MFRHERHPSEAGGRGGNAIRHRVGMANRATVGSAVRSTKGIANMLRSLNGILGASIKATDCDTGSGATSPKRCPHLRSFREARQHMKPVLLASLLLSIAGMGCRHNPPRLEAVPASGGGATLSLAAGTTLAVRTAQEIDSSSSLRGQTFAVVVSRDTNDDSGQTILPSGSPATLILLEEQRVPAEGGRFQLGIASVMLNGNSYLVRNETQAGDAKIPGASLGVFLGGVPGTQRLPSTGQSAESGEQFILSGERIRCPVGSLLTYRLVQPVLLIGSGR